LASSLPSDRKSPLYYGWVIVAVVALANFSRSAETFPVLGVFLKPMTEEFGWSRSAFSGAMTIGTLLGGFVAVGVGPLIDRFGPRWTVAIGLFVVGGTLVLLSAITSLWQFYVLEIIGRMVTMGIVGLAVQVIIPKWFIAKRGRAVALSGLGGRVGNTITPLYVQALVSMGNWRMATIVAGAVIWITSVVPSILFLRRRPEDMGLHPDGVNPDVDSNNNPESSKSTTNNDRKNEVSLSLKKVSKLASFYLLITAFAVSSFVATGLNLHMMPYFTDKGLDASMAALVVAVWSASGAVGSLLFGFAAERYSIRLVMSSSFMLTASGFLLLLFVHSTPLGIIWGAYQGMVNGGNFTLQMVIFADYYGRDSLGSIRGAIQPVQLGANAMGPLAAAIAYDLTGSYFAIFALFILLSVFSSLCIFLAKPPKVISTN
jgi:MFS family permease